MLNPNTPVIKWFNTEVKSVVGSVPVAAGFLPPSTTGAPPTEYIIIRGRSSSQSQGKSGIISSVTITLDIIVKNSNFGYKRSDEIAALILAHIDSDTVITLVSPFCANALSVEDISNLDGLTDEENVFRTILTYNLTVRQTI